MAYTRSAVMEERLADNRRRILLAARRLIASGGLRGASMNAVAADAGLSTGAIYRYFPSKSALVIQVLTEAVEYECAILRSIIAGEGTPTDRLRSAVASFARRALEGPNLAYAFIAEPADGEVDTARIHCRRMFSEVFKKVLREGVREGEFPAQSIEVSAACIVGAFTEALIRPVAASGEGANHRRLVGAIVDFCERAVSAPAAR